MYFLTIVAHDVTSQPLNASVPVMVAVLDKNDNPPAFASANFSFVVPEDMFPNAALVAEFDVRLRSLYLVTSHTFSPLYNAPHTSLTQ